MNNKDNIQRFKFEPARLDHTPTDSTGRRKTIISAFISAQDVKASSRQTYRTSIEQFFKWLDTEGLSISSLRKEDLIDYKRYLVATGRRIHTICSYLSAVRLFYKWTEENGLYADIANGVKPPKPSQAGSGEHFVKMHLTSAQGAALLAYYKDDPRDYAIVNLMLRTGLRTIEVSRARIGDISIRSGQRILHIWGKGMDAPDPTVFVILTDTSYGPIRRYLDTRPGALPGDPLFSTRGRGYHEIVLRDGRHIKKPYFGMAMSPRLIQMIIKKGLRAIGLDDHAYSAHSLRHTTATQIILNGGTILDVKRALRHSSINTSMIYTASIEEEERLRHSPESRLDGSFIVDQQ